jgi:recombination protein U
MGYWNTRGLRGNAFEELINFTNERYRRLGVAVIQKIPTPITPVKMDSDKKLITLAYFDKQSTVDYIGAVQGLAVCFDAKESKQKSLPIQNIHQHQIEFMRDFNRQKGIAFLLVHMALYSKYWFLPLEVIEKYWDNAAKGGRKSIPMEAFEGRYEIKIKSGILDYLDGVNTYLMERERSKKAQNNAP